jgi:hypothetical protein
MYPHRSDVLERIELAEREQPFCPACGRPTLPVVRSRSVWLECQHHPSRLSRLFSLDALVGHTHHLITEIPELASAG